MYAMIQKIFQSNKRWVSKYGIVTLWDASVETRFNFAAMLTLHGIEMPCLVTCLHSNSL